MSSFPGYSRYVSACHRLLNLVDFDLYRKHPEIVPDMDKIADFCVVALERIEAKVGAIITESAEKDGVQYVVMER